MIRFSTVLILAALLGACEPDDPKVRAEVAELRARVAELEKKAGASREPAAAAPATSASGLSRETLRRNLDERMPALRAALTRAFPEHRVDPVNAATISTPQDSDYLPYTTEVSFGLSKGQSVASFSIRIGADRAGNWQLPDMEDLAAAVGNLASSGATPQTTAGPAASGRGAMMDNNVRQIEWNDGGAAPSSSSQSRQPAQETPARTGQPSGNAPFPVQDSRTIQFD